MRCSHRMRPKRLKTLVLVIWYSNGKKVAFFRTLSIWKTTESSRKTIKNHNVKRRAPGNIVVHRYRCLHRPADAELALVHFNGDGNDSSIQRDTRCMNETELLPNRYSNANWIKSLDWHDKHWHERNFSTSDSINVLPLRVATEEQETTYKCKNFRATHKAKRQVCIERKNAL